MSILSFIEKEPRTLNTMVKYATREYEEGYTRLYGFGLNPQYAAEEMMLAKQLFHKLSKRQYKQIVFSFDENVDLPYVVIEEIGKKIGLFYAQEYQILMAVFCKYFLQKVAS